MAVRGVLTFGQWGYPIQGLVSYGRVEEKTTSSIMMRSASEQVNEASGDSNYLTESYLYRDQDVSEQDGAEIVLPETSVLCSHKKGNTLNRNVLEWQIQTLTTRCVVDL